MLNCTRLISSSSRRSHITALLKDRHWLLIRQCVLCKLCMLVHCCLFGVAPSYHFELVVPTATYSFDIWRSSILRRFASSLEQRPTTHKTYLLHGRLLKELEIFLVCTCILTLVFRMFCLSSVLCYCSPVWRPCYVLSHGALILT